MAILEKRCWRPLVLKYSLECYKRRPVVGDREVLPLRLFRVALEQFRFAAVDRFHAISLRHSGEINRLVPLKISRKI